MEPGLAVDEYCKSVLRKRLRQQFEQRLYHLWKPDVRKSQQRQSDEGCPLRSIRRVSNFTNATISGADLSYSGITPAQIAATSNYQQRDLSNVSFSSNDLSGGNFDNQSLGHSSFCQCTLINATFRNADLNAGFTGVRYSHRRSTYRRQPHQRCISGANLDLADLRNAIGFDPAGASSTNGTILPDGTIPTLALTNRQNLIVRALGPAAAITAMMPSIDLTSTLTVMGTLSSPDLKNDGTVTSSGNLTFGNITGNGTLSLTGGHASTGALRLVAVSISSGTSLKLAPDSPTSLLSNLSIAGSNNNWQGSLDLANDKLVLETTAITKATILATLHNQVSYGLTHSVGIFSTDLPAHTAIAVIDNAVLPVSLSQFGGAPVDHNSILIGPELLGDTNLDGRVDLNDLNVVLNNLSTATDAWTSGNFDGAATIDLNDLNAVLNDLGLHYANSAVTLQADALGAVPAAVPEPTSLFFLVAALPLIIMPRKTLPTITAL